MSYVQATAEEYNSKKELTNIPGVKISLGEGAYLTRDLGSLPEHMSSGEEVGGVVLYKISFSTDSVFDNNSVLLVEVLKRSKRLQRCVSVCASYMVLNKINLT